MGGRITPPLITQDLGSSSHANQPSSYRHLELYTTMYTLCLQLLEEGCDTLGSLQNLYVTP